MNLSETRYKQFSFTRFLLVGLQSLSLACAASALGADGVEAKEPVKKAVATYFPMQKGTWWKYRITRGDSVYDFTLRVVDVQKENNEDVYEIDTIAQQTIKDWYVRRGDQILRLRQHFGDNPSARVVFEPPYLLMVDPLKLASNWQWQGKGMLGVKVVDNSQVEAFEDLDLEVGKFNAARIVSNVKQDKSRLQKIYWYAAGVGLVKSKVTNGDVSSITELIDYSFKPRK
jgi:hypothetical protein